ncbi:MAG: potassium-transporting ATPase subunit KdpA [Xanthomonadales bacterium]|nr:Potassium-transporting ATPase potassium-binding subunit [Xanthomonadales bacterium]MCC6594813.1 potassium-transporting ATPase subunit KdpA [Xanthomonadales bacterium]MCE7929987.1 potassium-transporting ATPase subunit KdpA [Xanthomonadales bacterium PRO6]
MAEILLTFFIAITAAVPLGWWLARTLMNAPMPGESVFAAIETPLYRALGIDPARGMNWRGYARAFVLSNLVLAVTVFLLLMTQGWLPLNPDGVGGMSWDLALHTMVSFLTNTNQQHYSGQAQLSYLSQLAGIVTLQVVTPMMGLALAAAVLRALVGGRNAAQASEGEPRDVGNYYVDVIRLTLRAFLPVALALSLALSWQGVPSTFEGVAKATPVDASAGMSEQLIPVGPVAPMVAVKQLGTNGGGWYGPNSSFPLENPTPLSNLLQSVALVVFPMAVVLMIGPLTGRRRFAAMVFASMLTMSLALAGFALWAEQAPNAAAVGLAANGAHLEGTEVRLGTGLSALWSTLTTQSSNGAVNAMHDSLNPLAGLVPLVGMLINAVWGGIGCGLVNFIVYVWLAVFLSGLMIGRTPELFGRKLEVREIRLLSLLVILQPLLLLGLGAITLATPTIAGTSNPGFHAVSQVFYEYTSAYANNGSGFEGLGDATLWWNLSCVLALLAGRYACLLIPLAIAASLAGKRVAPVTSASLNVEGPVFAATLLAVIVLLTLLCFLPVLALGPIAEQLALGTTGATP